MSFRSFPNPFGELQRRYGQLKATLPAIVSNIAVNEFKENFRRQGYRDDSGAVVPWKKRKSKIDAGRGILTKSGRLRRSLRSAPRPGEARVVTNVPYAKIHNEGFNGMESVRAHKRFSYKKQKVKTGKKTKAGKDRMKTVRVRNKVIRVRAHKRRMRMPARPFMITTKPLMDQIDARITNELQNLFK